MADYQGGDNTSGTVIAADQVAIVYDPAAGYRILIPAGDDDGYMPEEASVLVAVAMRLNDDRAFYNEMLDWLRKKQAERGKPAH